MASSNRGVWIFLCVGAAIGVAAAFYYVTVIGPRGDRAEMADQIERWDRDKWQPTRACLVGTAPEAPVGYDAVVLRAAIPGAVRPRSGDCTGFFVDLARPGEVSSGNDRVETDWRDLSATIGTLANRYAGYSPDRADDREALGTALDQVDAAYATLRADAGMKPATLPRPVRSAIRQVEPVATGAASIRVRHVEPFGSALVVHGSDDTGDVIATLRGPAQVTVRRLGEIIPTIAGGWGAWTTPAADAHHELRAGPLDGAGQRGGPHAVVRIGTNGEVTAPVFTLGDDRERAILYELFGDAAPTLMVARSHDGGASWPEHIEIGDGEPVDLAIDPTRARIDLTWTDATGALQWLAVDGAALAGALTPRTLMPPDPEDDFAGEVHGCLGAETAWWLSSGGESRLFHAALTSTAPTTPVADSEPVDVIADCNDSRLLGLDSGLDTARLYLCSPKRCREAFAVPVAGDAELAATLGGDGAVAATLTNDLLVLWGTGKDDQPHPVFRLGGDLDGEVHLRGLVDWSGVVHAVLISGGKLELVPIPTHDG